MALEHAMAATKEGVGVLMLMATLASRCAADGAVEVRIEPGTADIRNAHIALTFDLKRGRFSGLDLASGTVMLQDAMFRLPVGHHKWKSPPEAVTAEDRAAVSDALGEGRCLRVWFRPEGGYDPERFLDVTLYAGKPFVVLGWGIHNSQSHPVRIRGIDLLSEAVLFAGQAADDAHVLQSGAGAWQNYVQKGAKLNALNGAMLTYADGQGEGRARRTVVAGGLRYAEFLRRVDIRPLNDDLSCLTLSAWDPQGKRIAPGETWESRDSVYIDFSTPDPFVSLEAYGAAMALANAARPNAYDFPTLCGWMVSTGYLGDGTPINHSPGLIDQLDRARAAGLMKVTPLAVRLEPDYYCYDRDGNTEQGWWDDEHFARYGHLRPPYDTFAKFVQAIRERGGICFTYIQASMPSNDFAFEHPEWMLNNDISLLHENHPHHKPVVRFDFSDPGFQAYYLAVWKRLAQAGLEGIKFDYPETAWALHGGFEDESYTTTSAYRKMYELCREGLGPDAWIHERMLGENDVPCSDAAAGVVDLQRVWGDASHFEPEMASRIGLRWFKQGKVFRYYPDGKSFYRGQEALSAVERRSFLTLVGLLSGRIELGTGFARMTPEMQYDLTRLYPVLPNGQAFRPVDMLLRDRHPATYVYDVEPGWKQVILIHNSKRGAPAVISAPLSGPQAETGSLGCDPAADYWVFDFWAQETLGSIPGSDVLARQLAAGEARIYSVRRALGRPRVLGTSRHVMCGMFEIESESWNAEDETLRLAAKTVAGEPLRITLSGERAIDGVDVTGGAATVSLDGASTFSIASDSSARLAVTVRFK